MCLILIALNHHPDYPLVLAANRDEYFLRPAQAANFWPEAPQLLAGRDLQAGGTWMGVTRSGHLAAVTNVREPGDKASDARSRGGLTTDYLLANPSTQNYLHALQRQSSRYSGFNLICGSLNQLYHYSNRSAAPVALAPGLHGISNHLLNTPWPKVTTGKQALASAIGQADFLLDDLLPILTDRTPAAIADLPDTGVGELVERALSSRFIHMPDQLYGTRSSTALRLDRAGRLELKEWTWDASGNLTGCVRFGFDIEKPVLER